MSERRQSSKLDKTGRAEARDRVPALDLQALMDLPPWEWPREAAPAILHALQDRQTPDEDRHLAITLAGALCDQIEDTFKACLQILACPEESESLRCAAAIALGPALEQADCMDPSDEEEEAWISPALFENAKTTLHKLWQVPDLPKRLRRRILEGAVRSPQDWHSEAIRTAFLSDDTEWKLSAVFAMNYVPGFEHEILEALEHPDPEIHLWAIQAAGAWELEKAWPHVRAILKKAPKDKDLLLAAIEATPGVAPLEACEILAPYLESKDEAIYEAAMEAVAMADGDYLGEDFDEDD